MESKVIVVQDDKFKKLQEMSLESHLDQGWNLVDSIICKDAVYYVVEK